MSVLIIFHDRIISLKEEVWVLKTSLTRPLVVEVAVPSHESVRSCNFVLGYRFCPFLRFANWILELFLQCGILELFRQYCILELFLQYGILELFLQCGILELFLQYGILELFLQCGILELFLQCGIFCFLFYY
jgi:hypothetical protein